MKLPTKTLTNAVSLSVFVLRGLNEDLNGINRDADVDFISG
jgi:hypothetical protein